MADNYAASVSSFYNVSASIKKYSNKSNQKHKKIISPVNQTIDKINKSKIKYETSSSIENLNKVSKNLAKQSSVIANNTTDLFKHSINKINDISLGTLKLTKDTFNDISNKMTEDINIHKTNTLMLTLSQISPFLGYAVKQAAESGIFNRFKDFANEKFSNFKNILNKQPSLLESEIDNSPDSLYSSLPKKIKKSKVHQRKPKPKPIEKSISKIPSITKQKKINKSENLNSNKLSNTTIKQKQKKSIISDKSIETIGDVLLKSIDVKLGKIYSVLQKGIFIKQKPLKINKDKKIWKANIFQWFLAWQRQSELKSLGVDESSFFHARFGDTEKKKGLIPSAIRAYKIASDESTLTIQEKMLKALVEMNKTISTQVNVWKLVTDRLLIEHQWLRTSIWSIKAISKFISSPYRLYKWATKTRGGYKSKLPKGLGAMEHTAATLDMIYVDSMWRLDNIVFQLKQQYNLWRDYVKTQIGKEYSEPIDVSKGTWQIMPRISQIIKRKWNQWKQAREIPEFKSHTITTIDLLQKQINIGFTQIKLLRYIGETLQEQNIHRKPKNQRNEIRDKIKDKLNKISKVKETETDKILKREQYFLQGDKHSPSEYMIEWKADQYFEKLYNNKFSKKTQKLLKIKNKIENRKALKLAKDAWKKKKQVGEFLDKDMELVNKSFDLYMQYYTFGFYDVVKNASKSIIESGKNLASNIYTDMLEGLKIKENINKIKKGISSIYNDSKTGISKLIDDLKQSKQDITTRIKKSKIYNEFSMGYELFKQDISRRYDNIKNKITNSNLYKDTTGGIKSNIKRYNKHIQELKNKTKNTLSERALLKLDNLVRLSHQKLKISIQNLHLSRRSLQAIKNIATWTKKLGGTLWKWGKKAIFLFGGLVKNIFSGIFSKLGLGSLLKYGVAPAIGYGVKKLALIGMEALAANPYIGGGILGVAKGAFDAYRAYKKKDEWKVSGTSAAIGGFFGGVSDGGIGSAANGAMKGAGIGLAFGGPVGALIGAAVGGIAGAIGGKNIAKALDWVGNLLKPLTEKVKKYIVDPIIGIFMWVGKTLWKTIKGVFKFILHPIDTIKDIGVKINNYIADKHPWIAKVLGIHHKGGIIKAAGADRNTKIVEKIKKEKEKEKGIFSKISSWFSTDDKKDIATTAKITKIKQENKKKEKEKGIFSKISSWFSTDDKKDTVQKLTKVKDDKKDTVQKLTKIKQENKKKENKHTLLERISNYGRESLQYIKDIPSSSLSFSMSGIGVGINDNIKKLNFNKLKDFYLNTTDTIRKKIDENIDPKLKKQLRESFLKKKWKSLETINQTLYPVPDWFGKGKYKDKITSKTVQEKINQTISKFNKPYFTNEELGIEDTSMKYKEKMPMSMQIGNLYQQGKQKTLDRLNEFLKNHPEIQKTLDQGKQKTSNKINEFLKNHPEIQKTLDQGKQKVNQIYSSINKPYFTNEELGIEDTSMKYKEKMPMSIQVNKLYQQGKQKTLDRLNEFLKNHPEIQKTLTHGKQKANQIYSSINKPYFTNEELGIEDTSMKYKEKMPMSMQIGKTIGSLKQSLINTGKTIWDSGKNVYENFINNIPLLNTSFVELGKTIQNLTTLFKTSFSTKIQKSDMGDIGDEITKLNKKTSEKKPFNILLSLQKLSPVSFLINKFKKIKQSLLHKKYQKSDMGDIGDEITKLNSMKIKKKLNKPNFFTSLISKFKNIFKFKKYQKSDMGDIGDEISKNISKLSNQTTKKINIPKTNNLNLSDLTPIQKKIYTDIYNRWHKSFSLISPEKFKQITHGDPQKNYILNDIIKSLIIGFPSQHIIDFDSYKSSDFKRLKSTIATNIKLYKYKFLEKLGKASKSILHENIFDNTISPLVNEYFNNKLTTIDAKNINKYYKKRASQTKKLIEKIKKGTSIWDQSDLPKFQKQYQSEKLGKFNISDMGDIGDEINKKSKITEQIQKPVMSAHDIVENTVKGKQQEINKLGSQLSNTIDKQTKELSNTTKQLGTILANTTNNINKIATNNNTTVVNNNSQAPTENQKIEYDPNLENILMCNLV